MKEKIRCPYCGHEQKVQRSADAKCKGVYVKCQGRQCRKVFEIVIK